MSLAHADAAVNKERVVGFGGNGGNGLGGGVRELIAGTDHKSVECKPGIEADGWAEKIVGRSGDRCIRCGGGDLVDDLAEGEIKLPNRGPYLTGVFLLHPF